MKNAWQNMSAPEIEMLFETNLADGLTESAAQQKQKEAPKTKKQMGVLSFLAQLTEPYHVLLILAAVLLVILGNAAEGIFVLAALLIKCGYTAFLTLRFERDMEVAERLRMPMYTVLREGQEKQIPADRIVQGDVLLLHPGESVCFSLKIVSDNNLVFLPENAGADYPITEENRDLSAVEPGVKIAFGTGKAVVADSMYVPPLQQKKPLQKQLEKRMYICSAVLFVLCALPMLLLGVKGQSAADLIPSFLGLFLAVCPLDMLISIRLCDMEGIKKLNKNSILAKETVEMLRDADCIWLRREDVASDKLALRGIVTEYKEYDLHAEYGAQDRAVLKMMQEMACLCTTAKIEDGLYRGSKEELAIISGVSEIGVYKELLDEKFPNVFTLPSEKRLTVGVKIPNGVRVISRGEPQDILALCDSIMTEGSVVSLSRTHAAKILEKAQTMRESGMYISALAFSDNEKDTAGEKTNLCFLGILGSTCVQNAEKAEFVQKCRVAQLNPILVTDLDAAKALAVGAGCGMDKILTGSGVDDRTDRDLERILPDINVFAQMDAAQEQRVLNLLKKCGKTVLYPAKSEADLENMACADLKIGLSDAPDRVIRGCGGTVGFMHQIPDVKRAAVNTYRNKNNVFRTMLTAKAGILLFALLAGIFGNKNLFAFLQMLWISAVVLPAAAWFLTKRDGNSRGLRGKAVMTDAILSGVLFGILLAVAAFFRANSFWTLTAGILLLGLQAGSSTVFIGGGFLKNKMALTIAAAVLAAGVVLSAIPKTAAALCLESWSVQAGLVTVIFVALLIAVTDLLKYIQFKRKEKEKKYGREV